MIFLASMPNPTHKQKGKKLRKITKKRIVLLAVAVAVAAVVLSVGLSAWRNAKIKPVQTIDVSTAGIDVNQVPVRLIAYRGLSATAPENTIVAVEKAARAGFTAVAFDIRETLDGVWVLMQNSTVNRMTNGRGKLEDFTYFELLNFNVDNGANIGEYTDIKIPDLEAVLNLCEQFGVRPYINIKQGSTGGITKLADLLVQRQETQNCAVLSHDKAYLTTIKDRAPNIELWLIAPALTKRETKWLLANEWAGVAFDADKKINTQDKVKTLIQAGKRIACLDVYDPQTIKQMYAVGVEDFYTCCILPK